MKKVFKTISIFTLLIGLCGLGLLAIGETNAHFSDTETTSGTFQAGTLDLDTKAEDSFNIINKNEEISKEITIKNTGSLDFQYQIKIGSTSDGICDSLALSAGDKEVSIVEGNTLFSDPQPNLNGNATTNRVFTINSGDNIGECEFDLQFDAWQLNLDQSQGFSDTELIENNSVTVEEPQNVSEGDVVINEVYYDVAANKMSGGGNGNGNGGPSESKYRWIELHNTSNSSISLTNWSVKSNTANATRTLNQANIEIGKEGFVVLSHDTSIHNDYDSLENGQIYNLGKKPSESWMSPDGDTLTLKDDSGNTIDSVSWGSDDVENRYSYGRYTNGADNWLEMCPTPGETNTDSGDCFEPTVSMMGGKNDDKDRDKGKGGDKNKNNKDRGRNDDRNNCQNGDNNEENDNPEFHFRIKAGSEISLAEFNLDSSSLSAVTYQGDPIVLENTSTGSVTLDGYRLTDNNTTNTIDGLEIDGESSKLLVYGPQAANIETDRVYYLGNDTYSEWLSKRGDKLILKNPRGEDIDSIAW